MPQWGTKHGWTRYPCIGDVEIHPDFKPRLATFAMEEFVLEGM